MAATLPAAIAFWSAGIGFGVFALVAAGGVLVKRVRGGAEAGAPARLKGLFGGLVVIAIPFAFATFCALFGTSLLLAIGMPPLAFPFASLAALVALRGALKSSSYGMQGCSRMVGIVSATYVAVWGLVAFHFTGGLAALDATGLAWLTPPLAALPFAGFITGIAGRKRTAWTFPGALIILSAVLALFYLPVEAGLGARWLPASDWLRFPLTGGAIGLLLTIPALWRALSLKAGARRRELKQLPRNGLLLVCILALTGLAWAGASIATRALAVVTGA